MNVLGKCLQVRDDDDNERPRLFSSDWAKIVFAILVQAIALAAFIITLSNDVKYLLRDLTEMKAEIRSLTDFKAEAVAQMRMLSSVEARVSYMERKIEKDRVP